MIYESLRTTGPLKVHNTVLFLNKLQWLGDNNIITARNNFVQIMGDGYPGQLNEQAACDLLLTFFDKSRRLSPEAQRWRRMDTSDPNRWVRVAPERNGSGVLAPGQGGQQ